MPPSEIAVSPCPDANKENLGAGPFSVLDCCTNQNIIGVSQGQGLPPNSNHTLEDSEEDTLAIFEVPTDMDARGPNRVESSQEGNLPQRDK